MEPKFLILEDVPTPRRSLSKKVVIGKYKHKSNVKLRRKTFAILNKMRKFCLEELSKRPADIYYVELLNILNKALAHLFKFKKSYNICIWRFSPLLSESQMKVLNDRKIRNLIKLSSLQKSELFEMLVSKKDRTIPVFLIIVGKGKTPNRIKYA